jgi:hypothetical protein
MDRASGSESGHSSHDGRSGDTFAKEEFEERLVERGMVMPVAFPNEYPHQDALVTELRHPYPLGGC